MENKCQNEVDTCPYLSPIAQDVKWLIRISNCVFLVGLAVIALGITAIFYAGGLNESVQNLEVRVERLEIRMEKYLPNGKE